MSNYPPNFRGTNFDHAEAVWSHRETSAVRDAVKAIAKYTDEDELSFDADSGIFNIHCEYHGADTALCGPEIEKAVGARLVALGRGLVA